MKKVFLLLFLFTVFAPCCMYAGKSYLIWEKPLIDYSSKGNLTGLKFSPDGKKIYVSTTDTKPFVVSVNDGSVISNFDQCFTNVLAIELSHDGTMLAAVNNTYDSVMVFNTANCQLLYTIPVPNFMVHDLNASFSSISFSYNDSLAFISIRADMLSMFGTYNKVDVYAWNTKTGSITNIGKLTNNNLDYKDVIAIKFFPNNSSIAQLTCYNDGFDKKVYSISYNVPNYNYMSDTVEHSYIGGYFGNYDFSISPSGNRIYIGMRPDTTVIYDANTEELILRKPIKYDQFDFVTDSSYMATVYYDGFYYNSIYGDTLIEYLPYPNAVHDLFSNKRLATGYQSIFLVNLDGSTAVEENSDNNQSEPYCSPNPCITNTDFHFTCPFDGNYKIEIFDLSGNIVKSFGEKFPVGENTYSLDFSGLTKSEYFVKISAGKYSETVKVVCK